MIGIKIPKKLMSFNAIEMNRGKSKLVIINDHKFKP